MNVSNAIKNTRVASQSNLSVRLYYGESEIIFEVQGTDRKPWVHDTGDMNVLNAATDLIDDYFARYLGRQEHGGEHAKPPNYDRVKVVKHVSVHVRNSKQSHHDLVKDAEQIFAVEWDDENFKPAELKKNN